ncbi:NAD(P)H-binding protein [Glaciecola petra]|uniref:Epimerase n=1 Tax=Glaciecola petra TaxID=3075602 RepID=A0ABU2ZW64_9ALTE|nr:NAD(P)H-binding protein [Aestuariibacter sp. P117]MDT0596544.1 epimerase [Aestuariibacter sp. P117]
MAAKKQYTAIVLGASGLVGKALLYQLCQDDKYSNITCLLRSPLAQRDYHDPLNKIQAIVIDFDYLQDYQGYFTVDHVYCCLGTTIKKAGSKKAFRRIDFEFVHVAAQLARAQRASSFVWISSVGANAKSNNFYLRVKGELENAILTMPQLDNAAAVRPSVLLGDRKEYRQGEAIAANILKLISPIMLGPLAKYRPVHAQQVAAQMISLQVFK